MPQINLTRSQWMVTAGIVVFTLTVSGTTVAYLLVPGAAPYIGAFGITTSAMLSKEFIKVVMLRWCQPFIPSLGMQRSASPQVSESTHSAGTVGEDNPIRYEFTESRHTSETTLGGHHHTHDVTLTVTDDETPPEMIIRRLSSGITVMGSEHSSTGTMIEVSTHSGDNLTIKDGPAP